MTDTEEVSALQSNLRNVQRQLDEARETLRDKFAMCVASYMIAHDDPSMAAINAYEFADCMMAARHE